MQPTEVGWFQRTLSCFLIYKCLVYLCQFNALFSDDALIYNKPANAGVINNFAFMLTNHYSVTVALASVIVLLVLSLWSLFNYSNYVSRFIVWLLVINVSNYLYPTLTAGDNLLNQLLFFNIFFTTKKYQNVVLTDLSIALHNMALLAIKMQVCLLYLLAGLFKWQNADWLGGNAIGYIAQIPEYSNLFLQSLPLWLCVAMTYATMSYQLMFPLLVFVKPLKKYVFLFGIIQHVVIGLAMGLFSFAMIMMMSYILFLKYDERKIPKHNDIS